jgi:hypothetical protein
MVAALVETLQNKNDLCEIQVITAVSVKKTVFWDVAPCTLVEAD